MSGHVDVDELLDPDSSSSSNIVAFLQRTSGLFNPVSKSNQYSFQEKGSGARTVVNAVKALDFFYKEIRVADPDRIPFLIQTYDYYVTTSMSRLKLDILSKWGPSQIDQVVMRHLIPREMEDLDDMDWYAFVEAVRDANRFVPTAEAAVPGNRNRSAKRNDDGPCSWKQGIPFTNVVCLCGEVGHTPYYCPKNANLSHKDKKHLMNILYYAKLNDEKPGTADPYPPVVACHSVEDSQKPSSDSPSFVLDSGSAVDIVRTSSLLRNSRPVHLPVRSINGLRKVIDCSNSR